MLIDQSEMQTWNLDSSRTKIAKIRTYLLETWLFKGSTLLDTWGQKSEETQ